MMQIASCKKQEKKQKTAAHPPCRITPYNQGLEPPASCRLQRRSSTQVNQVRCLTVGGHGASEQRNSRKKGAGSDGNGSGSLHGDDALATAV